MKGHNMYRRREQSSFPMSNPLPESFCEDEQDKDESGHIGDFDGKYLFRSLREDEELIKGLFPKNLNANLPPWKQLDCRFKTQYISTTATYEKAKEWADKSVREQKMKASKIRIVKIDVKKMRKPDEDIINLTDPRVLDEVFPVLNNPKRNFAKYYKEVLIKDYVKSDCLTLLYTGENDNVDQITEELLKLEM